MSLEMFYRETQRLVLMNQTHIPHRVPLSAKVDGALPDLLPRRQWNHSCLLSFSHPSEPSTESCWLCLQTRSCSDRFASSTPPVPAQASWLGVVKPSTSSQCLSTHLSACLPNGTWAMDAPDRATPLPADV